MEIEENISQLEDKISDIEERLAELYREGASADIYKMKKLKDLEKKISDLERRNRKLFGTLKGTEKKSRKIPKNDIMLLKEMRLMEKDFGKTVDSYRKEVKVLRKKMPTFSRKELDETVKRLKLLDKKIDKANLSRISRLQKVLSYIEHDFEIFKGQLGKAKRICSRAIDVNDLRRAKEHIRKDLKVLESSHSRDMQKMIESIDSISRNADRKISRLNKDLRELKGLESRLSEFVKSELFLDTINRYDRRSKKTLETFQNDVNNKFRNIDANLGKLGDNIEKIKGLLPDLVNRSELSGLNESLGDLKISMMSLKKGFGLTRQLGSDINNLKIELSDFQHWKREASGLLEEMKSGVNRNLKEIFDRLEKSEKDLAKLRDLRDSTGVFKEEIRELKGKLEPIARKSFLEKGDFEIASRGMDDRLKGLSERIENTNAVINDTERKMNESFHSELENRLNSLSMMFDEKLGGLNRDLTPIKDDIRKLEGKIANVESSVPKDVVRRSELEDLNSRLDPDNVLRKDDMIPVETAIKETRNSVSELKSDISNLLNEQKSLIRKFDEESRNRTEDIRKAIETLELKSTDLESGMTSLKDSQASNDDILRIKDDIKNITSRLMSEIEGKIERVREESRQNERFEDMENTMKRMSSSIKRLESSTKAVEELQMSVDDIERKLDESNLSTGELREDIERELRALRSTMPKGVVDNADFEEFKESVNRKMEDMVSDTESRIKALKSDRFELVKKIDEKLKERASEIRDLLAEVKNNVPDHGEQICTISENQGIISQSLAVLESNFNKRLSNLRETMYVLEKTLNLTLTGESRLRRMSLPCTDLEIEPYRTGYY